MKTMERPVQERMPLADPHGTRRAWTYMIAAVIAAFALGLAGGWALFGGDDDEVAEPRAILAGGGEMTARQQDMVDMVDDFYDAMAVGDGLAVEAMFAMGGTLRFGPFADGWESAIVLSAYDEGAIATFVEENAGTFSEPDMPRLRPPLVVDTNWVINYVDADGTSVDIFKFTASGDLAIADAVGMF